MSSIWTPSGEHRVPDDRPAPGAPAGRATGPDAGVRPAAGPEHAAEHEAEYAEYQRELARELMAAPVADVVANHAVGLMQVALLHLTGGPDGDRPPDLEAAALAIDAMAALVEGLGDRLAANAEPLGQALAQLRLAWVDARSGPG